MTDLVHYLLLLAALCSAWTYGRLLYRELRGEDQWDTVLDPQLRPPDPANSNARPAPHDAPTEPGTTLPLCQTTRAGKRSPRRQAA